MSKLLEKRNTIYGVCAIWIILFHTFRRIGMPYIPVMTNIVSIGNMAVDVFFFFSGLCLSLSANKHDYLIVGWKRYYKRRFDRVIIPYLIICIPYYLWSAVFENSKSLIQKSIAFVANISSASFWIKGSQTTWYVYGIIVFYLLFPVLFSYCMKSDWKKRIGLILGFVVFAIISSKLPVLKNSMIVWARLPIFTIGLIAGIEEERFRELHKIEEIAALVVMVGLGTLISFSEISEDFTLPQVFRLLLYIPMTISLLVLIQNVGKKMAGFEWIGNVSLEVYLIHITLLHPIKYYGVMDIVGYWLYLLLPMVTLIISWMVSKLEKLIIKE